MKYNIYVASPITISYNGRCIRFIIYFEIINDQN